MAPIPVLVPGKSHVYSIRLTSLFWFITQTMIAAAAEITAEMIVSIAVFPFRVCCYTPITYRSTNLLLVNVMPLVASMIKLLLLCPVIPSSLMYRYFVAT